MTASEWWLGLRDRNSNGNYANNEWDGPNTGYRNWRSGKPEDDGKCTEFESDSSGDWDDSTCSNSKAFICEAR